MFLDVAVRTAGSRGGEGDKHGQPQIASAKAAAHPTPSKDGAVLFLDANEAGELSCRAWRLTSLSFQRRRSCALGAAASRRSSPVGMNWRSHGFSPDPDAGRPFSQVAKRYRSRPVGAPPSGAVLGGPGGEVQH